MAEIPTEVYRQVESWLHKRSTVLQAAHERLMDVQARATDVHAPALDPNGGGHGSPRQDKLERAVMDLIAAKEGVEKAMMWSEVVRRIDIQFQDTEQRHVLALLYDEHVPQAQVAAQCYIDRQTVRRIRNRYVCHAALVAAELGLIRWSGGDRD